MNATVEHVPAAAAPAPAHSTHKFALLLKREFWEHRGGILWAPLIAAGVSTLLSLGFLVFMIWAAHKSVADGNFIEHNGVTMNGLDLGALAQQLSSEDLQQLSDGLTITLALSSLWPFFVMLFVAFFYSLGALYDDRKDRSVLFWKSLPISDSATVLSKVVTVTLVIPLIATVIAIVTMFVFLVALSIAAAAHGANPFPLLWGNGAIFLLSAQFLAVIPVYAAWMLPTVGWLLLCSSWAKSKPFLWALLIPLAMGLATSMTGLLEAFNLDRHWLWSNVIARMLLGIVPVTNRDLSFMLANDGNIDQIFSIGRAYGNFADPAMWAGVVAGVLMIAVAIRLRRWRDEG